jgi:hypothetical protein
MVRHIRTLTAGSLAVVLGLAACSDGNGPTGSVASITNADAQLLGTDVAGDVDEMIESSVFDASSGIRLAAAPLAAHLLPPACVTITPSPPANTDGDMVPDSARFTYDACVFTRAGGQLKDSLAGVIDFLDPLPNQVSLGVRKKFTDFTLVRTNVPFPARSFVAVRNGTREWGGNADTLGHTITSFVTQWTHTLSGRVTTHTRDWHAKFTADQAGSIQFGQDLPAGNWTLAGTGSWVSGLRQWSITVATATALHHNPACNVRPTLDAGELDLAVTRNNVTTNVTIQFTACGQFTVTRTLAN